MKRIIFLLFTLFHLSAYAQSNSLDGNWLKQGLDAYDRAYLTRTGSTDDMAKGDATISFLIGMIAVHRQNNFMAVFLWSNVKKTTDKSGKVKLSGEDTARIETTTLFTPLRSLPDNLSQYGNKLFRRKVVW